MGRTLVVGKARECPVFIKRDIKVGCLLIAVPTAVLLEAEGEAPPSPLTPSGPLSSPPLIPSHSPFPMSIYQSS